MSTTDVAGAAPAVEPGAEQQWRAVFARASVLFGLLGLAVLAAVLVANGTFWFGASDVDVNVVIPGGFIALAGVVAGFLGRKCRPRGAAVVGSVLSLVAFIGCAYAAAGGIPYEPGISGLAWSPDGTRIVYAHTWSAADGPDGIWVVAADGSSEPTHLVARGYAPNWSPDGTTIAYGATPNEVSDLWLMDADGSNPRKLSATGQHEGFGAWFETGHAWSPDGSQIVFAGAPQGESSGGIWIIGADGQNLRQVTSEGFAPDWSPDGTQIAYYTWPEGTPYRVCWVINVDGTGRTQLPGLVGPGAPQWTTDGRITVDCAEGLCVMDADGSNRQVLTGAEGKPLAYESSRVLSPDGTRVAYVTGAGIKSDIVVTTIDGSSQITLIH